MHLVSNLVGDERYTAVMRYDAAGGVVCSGGVVLVLYKPSVGEYRLPKGHIEDGETPLEAAVREIAEESGYDDLDMLADLGPQRVRFELDHPRKGLILVDRDEHYFLFDLRSERRVERPEEAHKFDPQWVGRDEAVALLTYEPEREWMRRGLSATPDR